MTGRCVFSFKTQTALKSKVLRVAVSKVRIPRSQRATLEFPAAMIYSAALSHSSIVAERPRFNSTGIPVRPTSFKSSKFCIFLAPTCSMETYCSADSTAWALVTSQIVANPVSFAAVCIYFKPSTSSPWKEYGEVRGL